MSNTLFLDPSLCTLRGHAYDARKFIDYLFLQQAEMIGRQSESLLATCEHLRATIPKISAATIEKLVRILKQENFAYNALFIEFSDFEKLLRYKSAEEFLESFLRKYL
jgi:hypothetical protein